MPKARASQSAGQLAVISLTRRDVAFDHLYYIVAVAHFAE